MLKVKRELLGALVGLVLACNAAEPVFLPVGGGAWKDASEEIPAAAGRPAEVRWHFDGMAGIQSRQIPRDWRPFSALAFTLESDRATNNRLALIIASENPAVEGSDYYMVSLPLDFVGTRDILLPFDEIGPVREPLGWQQIGSVQFHNNWSRNPTVEAQTLTFRGLRLLALPPGGVKGPRLTDSDLFGMLDFERAELSAVKQAWATEDAAGARHALAEHLRQRATPRWTVAPLERPTAGSPVQTQRLGAARGGRYQASVTLDGAGWQRVSLPLRDFQAQGTPVGWNWVSGVSLTWRTQGDASSGRELHLDDVALAGPTGERGLGDFESPATGWEGLYRTETLAHGGAASGRWWFPELFPSVTCQLFPADWTRFERLEFWVHATHPADRLEVAVTSTYPDTRRADEILTHTFTIGGFKKNPYAFGDRFDWSANAMKEGESSTIEWNAQLNRHFHFADLYQAYWATGDDKYAQELAWEMNTWIEDCPVLLTASGNGPYHHAWETLNTGIRLQNTWPETLARCIQSPAFTDDILVNVVKSVAEQVRHLLRHPSKGNWLTAESLGVYTIGVLFPEFREAAAWRREALRRLYVQLDDEVYPDGMEYEVALGYNNWVLAEYVAVLRLARLNGLLAEVPADYSGRIEKMFEYLMKDCRPDGVAFGLNDASDASVKRLLADGYDLFPARADFLYPLTQGRAGRPPVADSVALPYTGHYIMRSGWDRDARLLHLDAGLFGAGHQHEDKLSVLAYAFGKPLLVEGGVVMYDRSRWRAYVLLSRSHNTVLIDGMDQFIQNSREHYVWPKPWDTPVPKDCDTRWFSAAGTDWGEGWFRGAYREYRDFTAVKTPPKTLAGVQHRRGVLFVKPDYWVMHDSFLAADTSEHTAEALFHLNAESAETTPTGTVTALAGKGPGLILQTLGSAVALRLVEGEREPPVQGWSAQYGKAVPEVPMKAVPTAIYALTWRERGELITLALPYAAGQRPDVATVPVIVTAGKGVAAGFRLGEAAHLYLRNEAPGERLAASDWSTDAEVAAGCAGPGKALRLCLVNGKVIEGGGVALRLEQTGTASATAYAEDLVLVGVDIATTISLRLPNLPATAVVRLSQLDRQDVPLHEVPCVRDGTELRWQAEANASYEIAWGAGAMRLVRGPQAAKEAPPALDIPVRPLPPQPALQGTKVLVQAEDFSAQGGGEVEVTAGKVDAVGKSFLHWDNRGHWLDYTVAVPTAGVYHLTLRYCTQAETVARAVLVDGALPNTVLGFVPFPWTGGWSSSTSDWRTLTLPGADGKPFPLPLSQGQHTLRLINAEGSLNLDWLCLHSPDVVP